MGFRDEIAARGAAKPCKVAEVAAKLSAEEAADFLDCVMDAEVSGPGLVESLRNRNLKIGTTTIYHHRRRACSCFTTALGRP